jgi:hypothetical protein
MELPPGVQSWEYLSEPLTERTLQTRIVSRLRELSFLVDELSEIRPLERQALGLPDLLILQPGSVLGLAWLEVKRPKLLQPGKKAGTWIIRQAQGLRSFEQEERFRRWTDAGVRVATIDSVDMALGALSFWGYAVPPELVTQPFDPLDQGRFTNHRAAPRASIRAKQRMNGYWAAVRAGRRTRGR